MSKTSSTRPNEAQKTLGSKNVRYFTDLQLSYGSPARRVINEIIPIVPERWPVLYCLIDDLHCILLIYRLLCAVLVHVGTMGENNEGLFHFYLLILFLLL